MTDHTRSNDASDRPEFLPASGAPSWFARSDDRPTGPGPADPSRGSHAHDDPYPDPASGPSPYPQNTPPPYGRSAAPGPMPPPPPYGPSIPPGAPPPQGPPAGRTPPPPYGMSPEEYGVGPGPRRPGTRGTRQGMLAVIAVIIALVSGAVASVGTYLLTRPGAGVDPGYRIGAPAKSGTSAATQARPPESVAGVAAKVLPSVVSLEVKGNGEAGTGSGFVIKGGYVVTNNHVVAVAARTGDIRIRFDNRRSSGGRIVGRDPNSDIAVVKPESTYGAPEVTLGDSDGVVVGDPVIAIGSPLGLSGTVTTGIVSSLNRPVEAGGETGSDFALINAIQTDAAINPGNSGGPLVNGSGEVIGVNSAIATLGGSQGLGQQSGSIGLGFAIPVNQVRRIAEELITTGSARTSRIGISIDQGYRGQGVRISPQGAAGDPPVTPGGPAARAGLRAGDVILEVDGKPIEDSRELIVTIRSKAPGDRVAIKYQHQGRVKTATVTIGAAPAPSPS